jgi:hypothetical protein
MEIRDNHSLNLYPLIAVIIQDKRYRSCVCRVVLNVTLCLPVVGLQVNGRLLKWTLLALDVDRTAKSKIIRFTRNFLVKITST